MSVPTYFPGRGTIVEQTYLMGKAEGKAEGKAKGKAVGQAEAKAQAILKLLWRRGIAIPPNTQRMITSCTDLETLDLWFDRAITAQDIGGLFAIDESQPAT